MAKKRHYWHLVGYDSTRRIYDREIDVGLLSENQAQSMIQTLAAVAGSLTFDEVVGAYLRKRTKIHNSLLEVSRNNPKCEFMCGNNPHFIVTAKISE